MFLTQMTDPSSAILQVLGAVIKSTFLVDTMFLHQLLGEVLKTVMPVQLLHAASLSAALETHECCDCSSSWCLMLSWLQCWGSSHLRGPGDGHLGLRRTVHFRSTIILQTLLHDHLQ